MSRSWIVYIPPNATTRASALMMSRLRSSSRCSVTWSRSSGRARRGPTRMVLGMALPRPGYAEAGVWCAETASSAPTGAGCAASLIISSAVGIGLGGGVGDVRGGGGLAGDAALEVADAGAEVAAELGQPLRAEDQQRDRQHDHDLDG